MKIKFLLRILNIFLLFIWCVNILKAVVTKRVESVARDVDEQLLRTTVVFDKSAFSQRYNSAALYVGANGYVTYKGGLKSDDKTGAVPDDKKEYALSKVTLVRCNSNKYNEIYACDIGVVGIAKGAGKEGESSSGVALNDGKIITNLALLGGTVPVLTRLEDKASGIVYCVPSYETGTGGALKSPDKITLVSDSVGSETKEITDIVALAASGEYIFVAGYNTDAPGTKKWKDSVPVKIKEVDKPSRGIAVLKYVPSAAADKKLVQVNVDNFNNTSASEKTVLQSALIDVLAKEQNSVGYIDRNKLLAFYDKVVAADSRVSSAIISNDSVEMFYDSVLDRVYIGFSGLHRDDRTKEGGVCGVLVGKIQEVTVTDPSTGQTSKQNRFLLSQCVKGLKKDLLYDTSNNKNSGKFITSFYFDSTSNGDPQLYCKSLRVLHTSTGKDYLIVNSEIMGCSGISGGIATSTEANGIYALPLLSTGDDKGTISAVNTSGLATFTGAPTAITQMPSINHESVCIGGQISVNENPFIVSDIKSIFTFGDTVYACSAGGDYSYSGIFKSTALFNSSGVIYSWTPWQRVMGSTDRVVNAGIDPRTGNFYFLAQDSDSKACILGASHWGKGDGVISTRLSTVLNNIFTASKGGVNKILNFDEYTTGFKCGMFSMMVVLGSDTVAIAQTGKYDKYNGFVPVTEFREGTEVIKFSNDTVIKSIGSLSSAAFRPGYLFVGGEKGAAYVKLTDVSEDLVTELGSVSYFSSKTFVKLTGISSVECMASDGTYVYVASKSDIYKVSITEEGVPTATKLTVSGVSGSYTIKDILFLGKSSDTDGVSLFALATTSGLIICKVETSGIVAEKVSTLGNFIKMSYLPARRYFTTSVCKGNLYILVTGSTGRIYRFDVNTGASSLTEVLVQIGSSYYIDLYEARQSFVTDGSIAFDVCTSGELDLVNLYQITSTHSFTSLSSSLDINIITQGDKIGDVVRNSASGGWLIPGDFGVRVNE